MVAKKRGAATGATGPAPKAAKSPKAAAGAKGKGKTKGKSKGVAAKAAAEPEHDDEAAAASDGDEGPSTGIMASASVQQRTQQRKRWVNRQRVLVFGARGITERARHLMQDIRVLAPHSKTDAKLDRRDKLGVINEVCELKNCNNCVFVEMRRKRDMFMWVSKPPYGPSVKFQVENVHTMDELKMTGNALRASRPLLSFDSAFDETPHMQLIKELLIQTFGTPNKHPKSKPFFDHVFNFTLHEGRICFRNYQMTLEDNKGTVDVNGLQEIGPRFALNPVRVFEGSFGGETIYENPEYVTPAEMRREVNRRATSRYREGRETKDKNIIKQQTHLQMPADPLAGIFK